MTKQCYKCKVIKDLSEFHYARQSSDGRQSWCKECDKGRSNRYKFRTFAQIKEMKNNPSVADLVCARCGKDKALSNETDKTRIKYSKCDDCAEELRTDRKRNFNRLYGISVDEVEKIRKEQGNVCGICKSTLPEEWSNKVHLDHCHETNKIRGILCNTCNRCLGGLGDNVAGLKRAIAYLEGYAPGIGEGLLF